MNKFIKDICETIYSYRKYNQFQNKTILVTGANGLLGGFIADYLNYLNETYDFNIKIILTSLSNQPLRLNHLIYSPNVDYISTDISDGLELNQSIDYCFYCAGYAQPSKFLSNNTKTFFLNTNGLQKTFDSIYKINKHAKCIFLSSSEVYAANTTDISHKETDSINLSLGHKRNSYIFGKLAGELIVNEFRNLGYDALSARVSLCYGPGHLYNDARVMSDITRKGLDDKFKTIKLFDEGNALRRYIHISDFMIMLLDISIFGKSEVYNIGGKEEVSIHEMACHIGKFFNKDIIKGISNNSISNSAPNRVWVSLNRYETEFGMINFTSFKDGIDLYLKWFVNKFKEII